MITPAKIIKHKLIFLGTGSAFITGVDNYQSNAILEIYMEGIPKPQRILIDCGGDARHSLHEQGYSFNDIDAVYISHLHADHVGGLEGLAFITKFTPNKDKPFLYAHKDVLSDLWKKSLRGGLESLEGNDATKMEDYFQTVSIGDNQKFNMGNQEFSLVQTVHFMNGSAINPSFGLRWVAPDGKRIYFTCDTQFAPKQIECFYDDADIIFHDAETTPFCSGVHANVKEIITLERNQSKMRFYHYNNAWDDLPHELLAEHGFGGFIKKGEVFEWEASKELA